MTAPRSRLERMEDSSYEDLRGADSAYSASLALTEVGLTHIAMGQVCRGIAETWGGMRARPLLENLGTSALALGTIVSLPNGFTLDHWRTVADRRQQLHS